MTSNNFLIVLSFFFYLLFASCSVHGANSIKEGADGNCYAYSAGTGTFYANGSMRAYSGDFENGIKSGWVVSYGNTYRANYVSFQFGSWDTCPEGMDQCWHDIHTYINTYVSGAFAESLNEKYGTTNVDSLNSNYPNGCAPVNPCEDKAGTDAGYLLDEHTNTQSADKTNKCIAGCDAKLISTYVVGCTNGACVSSNHYQYTGQACGLDLDDSLDAFLDPAENLCADEWTALKNKCGGVAQVASFDWSTCVGDCSPFDNSCEAAWSALSQRCGGEGNIVNWNGEDCTGQCKGDPTPSVSDGDATPSDIGTVTVTHEDGSKTTTSTTTYNIDGTQYTSTTTTNYDSAGNVTGSSTSETVGNSTEDSNKTPEPTYSSPDSWYTPTYDLSAAPLSTYINITPINQAAEAFQETAIYQLPNLLLQCIGYVEGSGCTYPPTASVDFRGSIINEFITLDFSPFESVVKILKFFFSIICIVGTAKAVMALFN
nr:hypothetical protein [uncultured Desulfobulbus sp.]